MLMGKLLDILIRRLRRLCVDHMDVPVIKVFRIVPLHPVSVKYHDDTVLCVPLVIAHDIQEPVSGAVDICLRQVI